MPDTNTPDRPVCSSRCTTGRFQNTRNPYHEHTYQKISLYRHRPDAVRTVFRLGQPDLPAHNGAERGAGGSAGHAGLSDYRRGAAAVGRTGDCLFQFARRAGFGRTCGQMVRHRVCRGAVSGHRPPVRIAAQCHGGIRHRHPALSGRRRAPNRTGSVCRDFLCRQLLAVGLARQAGRPRGQGAHARAFAVHRRIGGVRRNFPDGRPAAAFRSLRRRPVGQRPD